MLKTLVERDGTLRGAALFGLGYWASCRVIDIAWLRMEHAHIGPKVGWLQVGYKAGKTRSIDLVNAARQPLHRYLTFTEDGERTYVFTSQRA